MENERRYAVDGWRIREGVVETDPSFGTGVNWGEGINYSIRGYATRDEAEAELAQKRETAEVRRAGKDKRAKEQTSRRRRAEHYHDKLYARAMELAADVDDIDVVEHYCQGHIDRLKRFIDARDPKPPVHIPELLTIPNDVQVDDEFKD